MNYSFYISFCTSSLLYWDKATFSKFKRNLAPVMVKMSNVATISNMIITKVIKGNSFFEYIYGI